MMPLVMNAPATLLLLGAFAAQDSAVVSIRFLDVGQGDATLIGSPDGKRVLVDGGRARSSQGSRHIPTAMATFRRSVISGIILPARPTPRASAGTSVRRPPPAGEGVEDDHQAAPAAP
jgi:hypothetical protein